jgi:hypothetical protein
MPEELDLATQQPIAGSPHRAVLSSCMVDLSSRIAQVRVTGLADQMRSRSQLFDWDKLFPTLFALLLLFSILTFGLKQGLIPFQEFIKIKCARNGILIEKLTFH